ncbi:MAG: HAD-IIIC family phosphatase [Flavobacteriales bacterium]|nr:HAD-IIIC family phosphatase [Flavobacteriales bacterium]
MKPLQLTVFTDITLDLVLREITRSENIQLTANYFDAVIPTALAHKDELRHASFILFYSDPVFLRHDTEKQAEWLQFILDFAADCKGHVVFSNLTFTPPAGNLKDALAEHTDGRLLDLQRELLSMPNVYALDVARCVRLLGEKNIYNHALGHLYQMPYTREFMSELANETARLLTKLQTPDKKVLVIDCDNTLWGGIVGEDGVEGLRVNRNADGIMYLHFQEFLKTRVATGFVLAMCSKNNEPDVEEVFAQLDMPLRLDDFVVRKINWRSKPDNISEIAEELNLGLDSFVFVDDSSFEINAVQEMLPGVTCIQFTDNYAEFLDLMRHPAFARKQVTESDLRKSEQYRVEAERQKVRKTMSIEEYIKSLEIKLRFAQNDENNLPRLSQMTEKTNQFNFNKEVLATGELTEWIRDGNLVISLAVTDKYGDYGIVGMALLGKEGVLRNMIMSCRALGRGIEQQFADEIGRCAAEKSIALQRVIFTPTTRNKPAADFLDELKKRLNIQ